MDQKTEPASATIYDRILRRIQKHLAGRVRIPFEIGCGETVPIVSGKEIPRSKSWFTTAEA